MVFILYIILGFFLGSIPFGLIVGKLWLGTDVRQQGSGNIGMTNVMRIGGKGPGILTFILDFAKGWLAVFLAGMAIIPDETDPSSSILFLSLVAASAVCGHIFSIFLHFRGGKGVSTMFGSLAALQSDFRKAPLEEELMKTLMKRLWRTIRTPMMMKSGPRVRCQNNWKSINCTKMKNHIR